MVNRQVISVDKIESAFRDIKSFIEVAPMYVWTAEHVRAHFTICFLSHLIHRTLTLRLHRQPGRLTKDVVSHEKLYQTLSKSQIGHSRVKNVGIETRKQMKRQISRSGRGRKCPYTPRPQIGPPIFQEGKRGGLR